MRANPWQSTSAEELQLSAANALDIGHVAKPGQRDWADCVNRLVASIKEPAHPDHLGTRASQSRSCLDAGLRAQAASRLKGEARPIELPTDGRASTALAEAKGQRIVEAASIASLPHIFPDDEWWRLP